MEANSEGVAAVVFGGLHPQNTLVVLKDISKTEYYKNQDNLRAVPFSYKQWEKLTGAQQAKVKDIWAALPESIRTVVITRVEAILDPVVTGPTDFAHMRNT
jgi:hypothetical protein